MESSYCYFIKTEASSNESLSKSNAEVLDSSNEDEESTPKSESSELSSKSKIDDETINMIPSDINALKKNLYNEEEFRSINHSEPIHIFLKIKPLSIQEIVKQKDEKYFKYHADTGVSVIPPKLSVYSQNKQSAQTLMQTIFHFSYVFQQKITQKDFFVATIYPCFEKFFNGENLLIFNYGVTNSGKTYTMQGTNTDPGLIPRSLDFLFESLKESSTNWQNESPDLGPNSVYKYKPDKFNEICCLSETELNHEMLQKENILRLSNTKEMDRFDSMRNLSRNFDGITAPIESSKKFGSLDSLATIASSSDPSMSDNNNTASMLSKIKLSDNKKYAIWISFYELYNDSIYDLLAVPNKNARATLANNERPPLKIREDTNRIPYVEGLTHVPVFDTKEAIRVLKFGEKNLQKSSNSINANSSRSHAVFCLKIVSIDSTSKTQLIASINQLSFCDLAGIERNSKTQAVGKTQKEASFINQSLSSLSRCINTMMFNQKNRNNPQQIPYRVNKLTRLFQAYFEGKSMVKMIVNFNPSLTCFDESVGVLKFSSIANQIQVNLSDEKKVEYKIDINTNSPSKNSQTVAWDSDCGEEDEGEDDDDEDEEDETGDESEEEDESDESDEEEDEDEESHSEESGEEDGESSVEAGEEEESGQEVTEDSSGEEEDEDDENEEEDDEEDDEENDEEEDQENNTHNQTAKKIVRTNETTIQSNKSHSIKKSFQKTPAAKKPIHLSKLSATASKLLDKKKTTSKSINKTISKANLSQLKSATYNDLNKDQLVALCKTMKKELDHSKKEFTKYESDIRNELVSTWSKRVEDTDSYYQEQIKIQRTQVEETFLKRMDMLEKLLNKKSEEKLDQLRLEKENELEKLREYQISSSLELRNLTEDNDKLKKETNRLLKLSEDLSEKLKEKIAEYKLLVDKNNYITANLLNSTAINSSINFQNHKFISPKNPVPAKSNESEIGCSLRLEGDDDEEEDEDEESDDTEEEDETEVEETQVDQTEVEEEETEMEETEMEETKADETEVEETEIEETQYEETALEETMDQSNHTKSKLITFGEQNTQTESVATRSVEVEANIPDEEIGRLKKIIDFKVEEIRILTEKIKSVENLNNQLNKIVKSKSTQESEFTSKITQLEKDLSESENSHKANEDQIKSLLSQKQQQTDLYDKLEIEFNKLTLSLEESKELIKRLETKLATFEKDNSQLKNEIAENQTSMNELTKDLADKAKKLEKNLSKIDDLEKAITKLTDDMEKKNFSFELLENDLQFKQNEVEKLTAELEESKALKLKIEDYNAVASKIRPSMDVKEEEKVSASKVSIGSKSSKNEVKEPTKESKSKSSDKSKKLSELKSIPEVKKSKLSKDRISVVNLSDDESKKADKRTSKSSKSTKPAKKTKDDDVSDTESIIIEKDSKKKSKGGETSLDENNSTSLSAASSSMLKPGQSNLTKKKSTLNRLTEMITKSPILEPLRKRPQRVAVLKPSTSNASDNASILQNSSNNISTASAKTSTLDKKCLKTKKTSSSNLAEKIDDCENMNPEAVEPDNGRKTRKKKA